MLPSSCRESRKRQSSWQSWLTYSSIAKPSPWRLTSKETRLSGFHGWPVLVKLRCVKKTAILVLAAVLVVALVCLWWESPWHPVSVFGPIIVLTASLWAFFAQWDEPLRIVG